MANGLATEVYVRRRVKDGWHVYTCDTLPGLYVAHKDDKVAYNDVPKAISLLMKLDNDVDCTVTHKLSYQQFVERIRLRQRATASIRQHTDDLMEGGGEYHPFIIQHSNHDHRGR